MVARRIESLPARTDLERIMLAEPRIREVLRQALTVEQTYNRWEDYSRLKRMIKPLVGWHASNQAIKSSQDYLVVIEAIDAALPECSAEYEDEEEL